MWLEKHQSVETLTWAPGYPEFIHGKLAVDGGWVEKPGATTADFRAEAERQGRSGQRHEIGDALEAEHAQLCGQGRCQAKPREGQRSDGPGGAARRRVLGITSIDPGRNDLLFERFVSEERQEPPDIDVDSCYRPHVARQCHATTCRPTWNTRAPYPMGQYMPTARCSAGWRPSHRRTAARAAPNATASVMQWGNSFAATDGSRPRPTTVAPSVSISRS
jgi:hypothetical protein